MRKQAIFSLVLLTSFTVTNVAPGNFFAARSKVTQKKKTAEEKQGNPVARFLKNHWGKLLIGSVVALIVAGGVKVGFDIKNAGKQMEKINTEKLAINYDDWKVEYNDLKKNGKLSPYGESDRIGNFNNLNEFLKAFDQHFANPFGTQPGSLEHQAILFCQKNKDFGDKIIQMMKKQKAEYDEYKRNNP